MVYRCLTLYDINTI